MSSSGNKAPILAFFCNWAPYRCYMDMGNSGRSPIHSIYPIKVRCAGRVDPSMLLYAFEKGAEGVMVIGCKDKDCQYGPGPGQMHKMEQRIRAMMHILGLEPERFSTSTYGSHESERLLEEMNAFVTGIAKLGRSPLAPQPNPASPGVPSSEAACYGGWRGGSGGGDSG